MTQWPSNLMEFFSRGPAVLHGLQAAGLPLDATLLLPSPLKIPPPSFNIDLLRPFSRYEPASLADFSARLPPSTESRYTREGKHVRCFRRLIVWRNNNGAKHLLPDAGRQVVAYYKRQLALTRSLWLRPRGAEMISSAEMMRMQMKTLMRVVIEQRPRGRRSFLRSDELVGDCEREQRPGGLRGGLEWSVECRMHDFAASPFLTTLRLLSEADVLVSPHGAGQANAAYMPPGSSVIEVRGVNCSKHYFMDIWMPKICKQSGFKLFWWGLFVEDATLVTRSDADLEGRYDARRSWRDFLQAKLDQNVQVQWRHLRFMLHQVADTRRNSTAYRMRYGRNADDVAWDVTRREADPVAHGAMFSAAERPRSWFGIEAPG